MASRGTALAPWDSRGIGRESVRRRVMVCVVTPLVADRHGLLSLIALSHGASRDHEGISGFMPDTLFRFSSGSYEPPPYKGRMIKRAVDENSLSDKLKELHEQWEPHDPEKLPKRLPVGGITLRPDVYQARGTRSRIPHGDVNEQKVNEMRELLRAKPEMDMTPVLVLHLPKAKGKKKFVLLDGHHRHRAYTGVSRSDIPVEYVRVNPTQAIQAANDDNTHIREPLSEEGKSQHGWRLLREGLVDHETGKPVTLQWISKTSGVSKSWVKKASMKLKEIRESGKEVPEDWFKAIGWERDDDGMRDETVERWAVDLRTGFPSMTTLGNPELFAKALCLAWPEKIEEIVLHLARMDGLRETYRETMEEEARERAEIAEEEDGF